MSGAVPVFQLGRWWTVLSAGWLHGSLLHIAFNLMWVRQLAPVTAEIYGPGRTILIYMISSVVGFSLSSLGRTVLRGNAVYRWIQFHAGCLSGHFRTSRSPGLLGKEGRCLEHQPSGPDLCRHSLPVRSHDGSNRQLGPPGGIRRRICNSCFSESLLPERLNHLAAAGVCLVLTAGAIVLSFVTGAGHV